MSSQTKAFKPPKLGCTRNTNLSSFLSNTISKWLAIKVSYRKISFSRCKPLHLHWYSADSETFYVASNSALCLLVLVRTLATASGGWWLASPGVLLLNTCFAPQKKSSLPFLLEMSFDICFIEEYNMQLRTSKSNICKYLSRGRGLKLCTGQCSMWAGTAGGVFPLIW